MTKERLSSSITDEEKQRYYEENKQEMLLDHCLIKGLFLKIPVDAPNINEVKKWYRSTSEASIEKIEKYSVQNASIYEYFYDKWIRFDEEMLLRLIMPMARLQKYWKISGNPNS